MTATEAAAMTATVTADGIAGLLPPLASIPSMSAVDTADMATAVRGLATEYAWDGAPPHDIDDVCDLRRKLAAVTSVVAQRGGEIPPDALIDLDTATRLIERAAVGVIVRAQTDGTVAKGDGPRTRLLGSSAGRLHCLHAATDWTTFAEALDRCRAAGSVKLSDVEQAVTGGDPEAFSDDPAVTQPAATAPIALSAEEVTVAVRGMVTNVGCAAEFARGLTESDVSTLSPAVSADLAKTLWDQMVITTRAYAVLQRRGQQRR